MAVRILIGDVREQLRTLPDNSVHCIVTSPPYWGLRDYGVEGQIGLEESPAEFIATMVWVFEELRRVLRPDGTCWMNMGDSYATGTNSARTQGKRGIAANTQAAQDATARNGNPFDLAAKQLVMMPHRLAIALQDAGWWVRQDNVWHKPNPMPESVRDRCTKAHEYIFLLTKSERYYYDADAVAEQAVSDHVPGNHSHNGQASYEAGDGLMRTKAGLVAYAERQRSKRDSFKRENSKRAAVMPGQSMGTHRPEREEGAWDTATRNRRSVWTIATQPFSEAHFATFPPELPEVCIKAGTSEYGVCSCCGAPYVRSTDATFVPQSDVSVEKGVRGHGDTKPLDSSDHRDGFPRGTTHRVTTGWAASCYCNAPVVPATVLDPFFGAGTTGLVADRLQRDCIGIELNPAYADMARKRIVGDAPLLASVTQTEQEAA